MIQPIVTFFLLAIQAFTWWIAWSRYVLCWNVKRKLCFLLERTSHFLVLSDIKKKNVVTFLNFWTTDYRTLSILRVWNNALNLILLMSTNLYPLSATSSLIKGSDFSNWDFRVLVQFHTSASFFLCLSSKERSSFPRHSSELWLCYALLPFRKWLSESRIFRTPGHSKCRLTKDFVLI